MKMINISECEQCEHGKIDDSNKARIKAHCDVKGKIIFTAHVFHAKMHCLKKEKRRNED